MKKRRREDGGGGGGEEVDVCHVKVKTREALLSPDRQGHSGIVDDQRATSDYL